MVTVKDMGTPDETGLGLATTLTVRAAGTVVVVAGSLLLVVDREVDVDVDRDKGALVTDAVRP